MTVATDNKICNSCGNVMLKKQLKYYDTIFDTKEEICDVEGYQCLSCNNIEYVEFDQYTKERIELKKHEKELEIMKNNKRIPIIISNLKIIRLEKKLSQKQIGNAIGVTEQRYGAIERNMNNLTVLKAWELANALDVSPDDLYTFTTLSEAEYEVLRNVEIIKKEDSYQLVEVEEVKKAREELYKIRDELQELNIQKREYRQQNNNGIISDDEFKRISDEIEGKKDEIKRIKDIGSNSLEKQFKKLESNYSLVIKQDNTIDRDDWDIIAPHYNLPTPPNLYISE